jgi:hypothetical protein
MKNWIWWQVFGANETVPVSGYYNINHEPEKSEGLFVSSFDDKGPFERAKEQQKTKIGFNYSLNDNNL